MLLLIKNQTDTLIEYTRTRPQGTLEFKMKEKRQVFLFNPPINLVEEGKWFLAVTSFEATISLFNINNDNKSFSITIPGHWNSKSAEKAVGELNELLELRSQNDIELHAQEVRKRGNQIKIEDRENKISAFDTFKKEILEDLKKCKIQ